MKTNWLKQLLTPFAASLLLFSVSVGQIGFPVSETSNLDAAITQTVPAVQRSTSEPSTSIAGQTDTIGCSDSWDTSFFPNGADSTVHVIVPDGNGNYYVGGRFTTIQGVLANGIAKWDGTSWSSLGSGVGTFGTVYDIAVSGNDVYVAGGFSFPTSGGNAKNVAKWNGTSWSNLGDGLGGGTHFVEAVGVFGGDVYFGGNFNTADGSPANGIVRWSGNSYSAVDGIVGNPRTFAVKDGALYVGGNIGPAPGQSAGLMKLENSTWSTMGLSPSSNIKDIAFMGSDIYALGTVVTSTGSASVGRYNGTSWTTMQTFFGIVNTIAVLGNDVYVGGQLPGPPFNNIARWTGTQWVAVGAGLTGNSGNNPAVNALAVSGNSLFVGGSFTTAGNASARNIATLTNGIWSGFQGTGLDSAALAIAVSGADVYVGGTFVSAGPVTANRIAKWSDNSWSPLGSGIGGSSSAVRAIAIVGNDVYAGGSFTSAGGISASNVAKWNGTSWLPLGSGVNGTVTAIKAVGSEIYVGGEFQTAGGIPANRIAKWNGTSWSAIPNSPIPNIVTGIEVVGNDIYVGSDTTTVENPNYLLKWDGTSWTPMAPVMGGHGVTAVAAIGSDIYISGAFSTVNGIPANRVAKWNGSSWSALGSGLPGASFSNQLRIAAAGPYLIASGDFTTATGSPAGRIARWDGTTWTSLGSGLDTHAGVITAAGGDIFVGGGFITAGCNSSPYFARWRENVWNGSASSDWHSAANWANSAIPPANAGVTIRSAHAAITTSDVTVSSLIITNGKTLTVGAGRTLTVTGSLDLSNGSIAGGGTLVVSGDLKLNGGNITGVASVTIDGSLYLNGGKIDTAGPTTLSACRPSALAGGGPDSFITGPFTRCVMSGGTYRFPVGKANGYSPVDVSGASGTGNFTVETRPGAYSGGAAGLPANRLQRWWQLSGSGISQADLAFRYLDDDVVGIEGSYRAYRVNSGNAETLPTALNSGSNTATVAAVTSFGDFTLAEPQASVQTLNGRVRHPDGRGIAFIEVTLSDGLGNTWTTVTKHSGMYYFEGLVAPKVYTVTVAPRKRVTFASPTQQVIVADSAAEANFTARP